MEGSVCSVHVMSSFFYPKLGDVGYSGVRWWTNKVKIYCTGISLAVVWGHCQNSDSGDRTSSKHKGTNASSVCDIFLSSS